MCIRDRKKTVSLKSVTLNNGIQKVNDLMGNPVIIGAVVIWKVVNPTKAVFNVEDYLEFLSIQTDSTIRNIARLYPYDVMDSDSVENMTEKTLRGSAQEIAANMKTELNKKAEFAGIEIEEVRICLLYTSYRRSHERKDQDCAADDRCAAAASDGSYNGRTDPRLFRYGGSDLPVGVTDHDSLLGC